MSRAVHGRELPFTGAAVVLFAGVGAGLVSAGGTLRKLTGKGSPEEQ